MRKEYMQYLKSAVNNLLDLVYPPGLYCISCGKIIDETRTYRLCNECMVAANWITDRHCIKCGRPLPDSDPQDRCSLCIAIESAGMERKFDKGYVCTGYGSVEQSVIFALKYAGYSDIGDTLGEILYDRMAAVFEPDELAGMYDLVVPVPIYIEKKKKRGFNHAELIGSSFAKRAGLRFDANAIKRTRATLPMKGLGPEERAANIRDAFAIRQRSLPVISGARILLIDDIFTTGATVDEIARILKENGASCVDFLAFAAA